MWCELARITTVRCGAFHVRYLHTMPHGLSAPEEEEAEEAEEEEESLFRADVVNWRRRRRRKVEGGAIRWCN